MDLPSTPMAVPERSNYRGGDASRVLHVAVDHIRYRIDGRLIADLAARFAAIEPEAIEHTIVDGLRQTAEALQFDRAVLWGTGAEGARVDAFHDWSRHSQPVPPEPSRLAAIPFIVSKLDAGEATWISSLDDVPDVSAREALRQQGIRSAVFIPWLVTDGAAGNAIRGGLAFSSTTTEHPWSPAIVEQLRGVAAVFAQALERRASAEALKSVRLELRELRERVGQGDTGGRPNGRTAEETNLRNQLRAENANLCRETPERFGNGVIVGQSAAIRRALAQAEQVAATDSTVLLLGETGTGKELIATHIHELSARRGRMMVRVNCAAIPSTLIESELFGREKGAFTGALARQIGRFELADHSTIFLDEIGDLPPDVQVKLLRVLEERQVERLGSPKAVHVNVRIVAATHRNLEKQIAAGGFREDLFYRLNVFPIQVPALRERVEDIPLLVWRFVDEFSKSFGKRIDAIPRDNMIALQQYAWPGNIRELRNVVERAMIVVSGTQLTISLPASSSGAAVRCSSRLEDVEKEHIRSVLENSRWRIRGSGGAAERLGLRPTTLETRMAKLGLHRPKVAEA